MNTMQRFIPILTMLAGLSLGYLGMRCGISAVCPFASNLSEIAFTVLKPIWIFCLFSLPVGVGVALTNQNTQKFWQRFVMWWLPLSVVVIYIVSSGENSWVSFYSYSQGEVAAFMASLFAIISLVIIVWKQFKLGKRLT